MNGLVGRAGRQLNPQRVRHVKNAAWSVAEGVGYPLLLLGATPLLLGSLGAEGFGLWTLLIAVTSAGMVIGIGLSPAVIKLVAEHAHVSPQKVDETVRGALAVAAAAGGAFALIVVVVTVLGADSWLSRMGAPHLIIATGLFSAAILWVEQFDLVVSAVIKGLENFSLAARLEIGLKLSQIGMVIVTAMTTRALVPVYSVFLLMATLRLVVKALSVRRQYPGISLRPGLQHTAAVLRISKWGWLQGVGSIFFLSGDRFIIGASLGAVSLGYYSIALQLVSQLHSLIANAFSIIVPRVSKMGTSGDARQALRGTTYKLMSMNVAMACVAAAAFWFVGPWFLAVWVGPEVTGHIVPAFGVLVVAYGLLALSIVPFHVLTGLGALRPVSLVMICGGVLTLGLTFLLVPTLGLEGAALARCVFAICALTLTVPVLLATRRAEPVAAPA